MELGLGNSLLARDPRLIDHIVGEVKSQGIFDQFRKECIADVDTKPAYQNLRTRVESSVNSFLNKQTWKPDLNKNQLRETLRKHIHDAPYLEVGVERIVDQVVNPKIYSVFMPQIEDVVYKFLGIERPKPQRNGACDLKDLLPKDLDPVSPESDRNSLKDVSLESVDENMGEMANGDEQNDEQKPRTNNIEENKDIEHSPFKKEVVENIENGEGFQIITSSPIKTILNSSFKSDETNKTEEEEEDSPVFEPIDAMNLNESNMSNDSHLSGISELTSHRSQSPDFMTEFSRDNFDCSNQDSQLSKVSSNSRLSIVTDFGSSNHASTPVPDSKEDSKCTKDNFKAVREFDNSNKDNKFNFEAIKGKDSKTSNSSKENSRDGSDYKDNKSKEESSKSKYLKDKHDSRSSRDKDRDSRRHHSSKSSKHYRSKSKDKNESESQESKENSNKYREIKVKEIEKKDDVSKEVKDLKDLYKEKIRELREKKELTEKEKLGKDNKDSTKNSKDPKEIKESSSSREKDDYRKSHKSSSSFRSSSNHKSSRSSESKDSRERSSSNKRDDRRHSSSKSESKSSKNRRDSKTESKSESRSSDRSSKDKKRRDEKKSKSTDDHSSLRKNSNDRRSTDRDGSNGSSSKYSHKSSHEANNSSGKLGPSASLTKDSNKEHHSSSETSNNVNDSLEIMLENYEHGKGSSSYNHLDNPPKRVDPGSAEICLPLKKRPLHDSPPEVPLKKVKVEDKKASKKKIEKDIFKIDVDVASVPDEERVQIIEIPDEEYDAPYPEEEPILSLEETKKIILDADPVHPTQSKLSEMEQSIRQSLSEMMSDHKINDADNDFVSKRLTPITNSNYLIQTLADASNIDSESSLSTKEAVILEHIEKIEGKEESLQEVDNKIETDMTKTKKVTEDDKKKDEKVLKGKEIVECNIEKGKKYEEDIKSIEKINENFIMDIEQININVEVNTDLEKVDENIENDTEKIKDYKESTEKVKCDDERDLDVESVENIQQNLKEDVQDTKINTPDYIEKREQDITNVIEKMESCATGAMEKTQASSEDLFDNKEKYTDDIQDEGKSINESSENVDKDNKANVKNTDVNINEGIENMNDNIDQDDESIDDNTDDFNEEDKLVIDEEFDDEKRNEDEIEFRDCETLNENLVKSNENEKIQEHLIDAVIDRESKKDAKVEKSDNIRQIRENDDEEQTISDGIIAEGNDDKIVTYNEIDDGSEKVIEFVDFQEQIKDQLNNELYKLNEDESDGEKESDKDEVIENDSEKSKVIELPIEEIIESSMQKSDVIVKPFEVKESYKKLSQQFKSVEDEKIKLKNIDNEDEVKSKKNINDHEEMNKNQELTIACNEKEEDKEELTLILNEESCNTNRISPKSKETTDSLKVQKSEEPTSSGQSFNTAIELDRKDAVVSPIEEDCLYLESDNQKYLAFKRFLEKLEVDPNRSLENMIESFGGMVVPAVPMASTAVPSLKRKQSASPIGNILITNANNNNDGLEKAASTEPSSKDSLTTVKKRKVGRMKKVNSSSTSTINSQQLQQQQQSQQQLKLPQQLQKQQLQQSKQQQSQPQPQPQVAIANGENFEMPLSPESDVSATSEKNPGSSLRDERSRSHRSNQRYSSDDLYKPRPLFSSSSRRNRRFHQA